MIRGAMIAILSAATLLAGCSNKASDKAELDRVDAKLEGKVDADPALSAALEDQIMVDPKLATQSNEDSIRPPNEPFQAPIPVDPNAPDGSGTSQTLGSLAERQAILSKDKFNGCLLDVQYSMDFVNRLPSDLPLYPGARLIEAAGSDARNCRLRAVSYSTAASPKAIIDYYLTIARRAGYTASHNSDSKEEMVNGSRERDGAAFYTIIQAAGAGSSVDLVVNNGR
jgi:outer membrane murein-binding lipoprotein Lpp